MYQDVGQAQHISKSTTPTLKICTRLDPMYSKAWKFLHPTFECPHGKRQHTIYSSPKVNICIKSFDILFRLVWDIMMILIFCYFLSSKGTYINLDIEETHHLTHIRTYEKYHPRGAGGTRSPPATPHRLLDPKCSDELSLNKFLI